MNNSAIRKRITFSNVVAVLALFVALGGASYAATKINGKSIKKLTISGKKLKPETIDGSRINEGTLAEVPSALRAGSAGSADTATTAETAGEAQTAGSAKTAATANTAKSAATAENANALGGLSASQLRVSADTSAAGSCDPTGFNNPVCATQALNLPATSDVVAIARASWYGTDAGPDKGECFVSIDPNVNTPSGIRAEVGQVDAEHTDFDTAGDVSVHTTIDDVPAGNHTFRMRCYQEDGDFKVEDAIITVMRVPS